MSKKGGSSSSSTSSKPYLAKQVKAAAGDATALYDAGGGYYTGSSIADPSAETNAALAAITAQANGGAGNGLTQAGADQYLKTINGDYLNSNPYLQQVIDASAGDVTRNFTNSILPQLNSTFATSGRYGSGIQEQSIKDAVNTTGQNISDAASNLRYQNYAGERQNQLTAAANAGAVNQNTYQDAQQLAGVGTARDALAQARLQDQINQYQIPQQALNDYIARLGSLNGNIINPQTGGAAASSGGLGGVLGGAASGAALGASIGGPYGAVAGGILGLFN